MLRPALHLKHSNKIVPIHRAILPRRQPITFLLHQPTSHQRTICFSTTLKMASLSSSSAAAAAAAAYDQALSRLSSLQSNTSITSLFTSLPAPSKKDINSLAIPEMQAWCVRAGLTPELLASSGLKCVHVAGTKGKGSVSSYVASILQQYSSAGTPVGLYTSPHLVSVRERINIDGKPVSRELFTRYVNLVWDALTSSALKLDKGLTQKECEGPGTKPFYFRFLTIVALRMFVDEGIKNAVVECGIGGEYDSTNAVFLSGGENVVSCAVVTQLGIDHVGMLGDTVEKIAWHKAGIFKPQRKGFTLGRSKQNSVIEVLRERAREKGAAELVEVGEEEVREWDGVEDANLEGPFAKGNMALAVHAAREHLLRQGVKFEGVFGEDGKWTLKDIPEEFVKGLREARLRGRCEIVNDKRDASVEWCVDGAHTEDSLAGVGEWFAGRVKEDGLTVLVFNQQDRDPAVLLKALLNGAKKGFGEGGSVFTHAIFTRNEENRAKEGEERDVSAQRKAEETMKAFDSRVETSVYTNVGSAVEHVRVLAAQAKKEGKSCKALATGSFYLVGGVLRLIDEVEY
ncbi:Mur ligase [Cladorrhinum sp. PSN259]|nr:Mur ligase [Cladorrhinum sp. PSN259]